MERYDYRQAVKDDVAEYIREEVNLDDYKSKRDELEEELNERLWMDDSVTGNASGSYYCNAWKAEEALCHNWDLLSEAFFEFGENSTEILDRGPESCDVTIRCYLLGQAIHELLDDMEEEGKFDDDEEDDDED